MKLKGKLITDAKRIGMDTGITLNIFGDHAEELNALGDEILSIEVKKYTKRRSLSANALCWELCSQIGAAMRPPLPRETVYRMAIRDVGQCEHLYIREDALEAFDKAYASNGIGWFTEKIGDAPLRGYVEVVAFQGSSSYGSKAMSVLIDYLMDTAEQMELPIGIERKEIEKIKGEWQRKEV